VTARNKIPEEYSLNIHWHEKNEISYKMVFLWTQ